MVYSQGAQFTFTVPAVDGEGIGGAVEPAPLAARSGRAAREQVRILAVDDDPQALRYVRDCTTSPNNTSDVVLGARRPR